MSRWKLSLAVAISLILCGSLGRVFLRMPKYHFVAPHMGYLASALAEYDLLVPAHSRLFSRVVNYLTPPIAQACTFPGCNAHQSKPSGYCPDPISGPCTQYL